MLKFQLYLLAEKDVLLSLQPNFQSTTFEILNNHTLLLISN